MATREHVPGSFRNFFGLSVADALIAGNGNVVLGSQWTPGATLIDKLEQQQFPSGSQWELTTLTVNGHLGLTTPTQSLWGKFGKIVAGLVLQADASSGDRTVFGTNHLEGGSPWTSSLQDLPDDTTLLGTLWDASSDLPPQIPFLPSVAPYPSYAFKQLLPITTVISPPTPLIMQPGSSVGVGIWMFPSLIGCNTAQLSLLYELQLYYASYQLVFSVQ